MKRDDFPPEDSLPTNTKGLLELIERARDNNLSFRYVNVLRHRLMDQVAAQIERGEI